MTSRSAVSQSFRLTTRTGFALLVEFVARTPDFVFDVDRNNILRGSVFRTSNFGVPEWTCFSSLMSLDAGSVATAFTPGNVAGLLRRLVPLLAHWTCHLR